MNNVLRIEGDPVSWILYDATIEALAQRLTQSGDPIALRVVAPIQGRLVLSPRCAGSVALLAPPGGGWVPGHIMLPASHLYVASRCVTRQAHDRPMTAVMAANRTGRKTTAAIFLRTAPLPEFRDALHDQLTDVQYLQADAETRGREFRDGARRGRL